MNTEALSLVQEGSGSVSKAQQEALRRAAQIREVVSAACRELRARHPLLRHQDWLGGGLLLLAVCGMLGNAWLYGAGYVSAWLALPCAALLASITHEVEHDLVHWLYFRQRPWAHHLCLALAWLARPSTINPWFRRELHFNHHRHSGMTVDWEERAITNGEPWGVVRLLMTLDAGLAVLFRLLKTEDRQARRRIFKRSLVGYFPLGWLHWGGWYVFLGYSALNALAHLTGTQLSWSAGTLELLAQLKFLVVVWIGPNVLRSFCLHFVSSNIHYYGDIREHDVMAQTQVLTALWSWPFQLFCFAFGATHAIHHFVVQEPFYVRQLTASVARQVMREMGVRFNDTGTFARANRYRSISV